MSHYVKRTRTRDRSASALLFGTSQVGRVQFSRTFRTEAQALREADAWNQTGDWSALVYAGRAPKERK